MKYQEFQKIFRPYLVFSFLDVKKYRPDFDRRRLSEWSAKGYIKKIVKGYYTFSDYNIDERFLYLMANTIYRPSYISLTSALAYYGLIPEGVYSITSISTKKTTLYKTEIVEFHYKNIKESLFFGYKLLQYRTHFVKIAEPEKAILDFFYFHKNLKDENDFYELRINEDVFHEIINPEKFMMYKSLYAEKTFSARVDKFLEFIYAKP